MKRSEVLDYYSRKSFELGSCITVDQIVRKEMLKRSKEKNCPLVCYQGRFHRYDQMLGYFKQVDQLEIKLEISMILPRIYVEGPNKKIIKKCATSSNASSAIKWVEVKSTEMDMNKEVAVAFNNGTLYWHSSKNWELGEHSPDNKLTYAINGDWTHDADCPPIFKEFVRTSYGLEWLPILRGVLAYHADPRYGCKVITLIIGNSGTGKGVTERLLERMFPSDTIGIVTSGFKDLNNPDKISQLIAGKRLIAFPDLQGHQEGLGAILSLTDGGLLTARPLFSNSTFQFVFKGRVVICSTQAPAMENAGVGMVRRFLTLKTLERRLPSDILPTDGEEMEELLHKELGNIVSWAMQMPEAEVRAILQSKDSGGLLKDASNSIAAQLDATRDFIDSCLVPCDSLTIPNVRNAFQAYQLFCNAKRYKCCNEGNFRNRLKQALPHLYQNRRAMPGSNSNRKIPAFFFGFQLRPGLWHEEEATAKDSLNEYLDRMSEIRGQSRTANCAWNLEASIVEGARHEGLGYLVTPLLMDGQLAVLNEHTPEVPSYDKLVDAGYVGPPEKVSPRPKRHTDALVEPGTCRSGCSSLNTQEHCLPSLGCSIAEHKL